MSKAESSSQPTPDVQDSPEKIAYNQLRAQAIDLQALGIFPRVPVETRVRDGIAIDQFSLLHVSKSQNDKGISVFMNPRGYMIFLKENPVTQAYNSRQPLSPDEYLSYSDAAAQAITLIKNGVEDKGLV